MSLSIQERLKTTCGAWLTLGSLRSRRARLRWAVTKRKTSRTSATMPYPAGEVLRCDADYLLGLSE